MERWPREAGSREEAAQLGGVTLRAEVGTVWQRPEVLRSLDLVRLALGSYHMCDCERACAP